MKTYELLNSPDKWCKGANALSESGASVNDSSPGACKWCVNGALRKCYPTIDERSPLYNKIWLETNGLFIAEWNDAPERTWQEVHDLLVKLDI
jgi:hypothetical protein